MNVSLRPAGLNEKVDALASPAAAAPPPSGLAAQLELSIAARAIPGRSVASPPPPWPDAPRRPGEFNTETYDRIDDNRVPPRRTGSALDVLDRRRHRLVRERPPLSERRLAAAGGRGAHRGDDQLLPLRLSAAARAARRSRSRPSSPPARGTREHRLALIGLQAQAARHGRGPGAQPRVPARRVRLDGATRQAAAGAARRCACSSTRSTARDRIAIVVYAGASGIVLPSTSGAHKERDPRSDRQPRSGRLDQRRRRGSRSPTRWRRSSSSRAASTASSSRPTATSTSASPTRAT